MTLTPQADRLTLHNIAAAHQQLVTLITDTDDWPARYPDLINLTYTAVKDQVEAARDHVERNGANLPGSLATKITGLLGSVQRMHRDLDYYIENHLPTPAAGPAVDILTCADMTLEQAAHLTDRTVTPL